MAAAYTSTARARPCSHPPEVRSDAIAHASPALKAASGPIAVASATRARAAPNRKGMPPMARRPARVASSVAMALSTPYARSPSSPCAVSAVAAAIAAARTLDACSALEPLTKLPPEAQSTASASVSGETATVLPCASVFEAAAALASSSAVPIIRASLLHSRWSRARSLAGSNGSETRGKLRCDARAAATPERPESVGPRTAMRAALGSAGLARSTVAQSASMASRASLSAQRKR
eukprot:46648-Pleurochrysis_carterae.AAC.1